MSPCDVVIGSDFVVGLGPEDCNTPGVQSTNITYFEVEEFDDPSQIVYTEKRVAAGRRDNVVKHIENDKFSDGTIGGSILQESFGLVMRGVFGLVTTDAVVIAPDFRHCFTPEPTACICTTSIVLSDPLQTRVINNAIFKSVTISGEVQGDITYTAAYEGKFPVVDTLVTALLTENTFEPKTFNLYVANDLATIIGGVPALCIQAFELNIENTTERRYCLGTLDPNKIISTQFDVTGSFTVEYDTTSLATINDWIAGSLKALRIQLIDSVNLLPGGNPPTLTIDLNQIHFDAAPIEAPIDGVATVNVEFTAQLKLSEGQTIEVCLDNGNDGSMYLP